MPREHRIPRLPAARQQEAAFEGMEGHPAWGSSGGATKKPSENVKGKGNLAEEGKERSLRGTSA